MSKTEWFTNDYLKFKFDNALVRIEDSEGKSFYSHNNQLISKESVKCGDFSEWRIKIVQSINKVDKANQYADFIVSITHENANFDPIPQEQLNNIENLFKVRISAEKANIKYTDEGWTSFPVLFIQPQQSGDSSEGKYLSFANQQISARDELPSVSSISFSIHRITISVIGCGNRGSIYARYSAEQPEESRIVAIVDPKQFRRSSLINHPILSKQIEKEYTKWEDLLEEDRFTDAIVVAILDQLHCKVATKAAEKGYHILLEKPIALSAEDCNQIVNKVEENNCLFAVCHVLRYTPYSRLLKSLLDSLIIGKIINIQHMEPIGNYHFAHSYVRGNWRNSETSSFSLLTKSCHDIDWINWIMGKKCTQISSFGSLYHFKSSNKPLEASDRCVDCKVEEKCCYSAKKIYLNDELIENGKWPVNVIVDDVPTRSNVEIALRLGPYGRCVYQCDNNVVDNQVVNLLFDDQSTASFSMIAFTKEICVRKSRIFGELGTLECDDEKTIYHFDFLTRTTTVHHVDYSQVMNTSMVGHGFGDYFLMRDFVRAVAANNQNFILSGPREALNSHLMVFHAEQSRLLNQVISL